MNPNLEEIRQEHEAFIAEVEANVVEGIATRNWVPLLGLIEEFCREQEGTDGESYFLSQLENSSLWQRLEQRKAEGIYPDSAALMPSIAKQQSQEGIKLSDIAQIFESA